MPTVKLDLTAISLFSGGGGMDVGFDRSGFKHLFSIDQDKRSVETLKSNFMHNVYAADLRKAKVRQLVSQFSGNVDLVHAGPPCQPFSIAGKQLGEEDPRDCIPLFVKLIGKMRPKAFVMENVPTLSSDKFNDYIKRILVNKLKRYQITKFYMHSEDFGLPQRRNRIFFVGFIDKKTFGSFRLPRPNTITALGLRRALGLRDIGFDVPAPTLCAISRKRPTTSIARSSRSTSIWSKLQIWPSGVQKNRHNADEFVTKNGHYRLSIDDLKIIQGFPNDYNFCGPVYEQLIQIGNSVCPPVAYAVGLEVARALSR